MATFEVQGMTARAQGRPPSKDLGQGQCRMMRDGSSKATDERSFGEVIIYLDAQAGKSLVCACTYFYLEVEIEMKVVFEWAIT